MTTPVYNPDVPLRKDIFASSQVPFLDNFFTLNDAFSQNHVALDSASNAGNHTIIQLLEQATQFQTNTGEISVYSKDVEGQTDQIFFRYQGNQDEFQFTNYQIYTIPGTATQTFFFTFLPGKILIYFGTVIPTPFTIPQQKFTMELIPAVARNIICANFCPIAATGAVPLYPPISDVGSTIPGIFNQLILSASFTQPTISIPPCYYFVMANI